MSANDTKIRLLSISTSPITYDFEQAKKPGRTGWATQSMTNSLLSDLLPGFNVSLTHDLFRGQVGSDTAKFDPFLQNVSASFAVSGNTFRSIGSIFGLGGKGHRGRRKRSRAPTWRNPGVGRDPDRSTAPPRHRSGEAAGCSPPISTTVWPAVDRSAGRPTPRRTARVSGSAPTSRRRPFWSLSWSSQYNITDGQFEIQVVRLERDLHEWRARFNFVRNPNGNFAFYFSIYLTDLPELKFDYDQTTFEQ